MDLNKIFNSSNSSVFKVDKIYLKLISYADGDFINELFNYKDVREYFILSEAYQSDLYSFVSFLVARFRSGQGFDFIIYDLRENKVGLITCEFSKNNGRLIGNVAYAIHPSYRKKGYATEALQFVCRITDQSQFYAIRLDIKKDNIASERIAENLGFKTNRHHGLIDFNRPEFGIRHAWYRECVNELPKRVELSVKAINCFREGRFSEARDILRESLKYNNPVGSPHTDAQIYSNLGMALIKTKQYKEAYGYLMKAYNAGLRNDILLKQIDWLRTNAGNSIGL